MQGLLRKWIGKRAREIAKNIKRGGEKRGVGKGRGGGGGGGGEKGGRGGGGGEKERGKKERGKREKGGGRKRKRKFLLQGYLGTIAKKVFGRRFQKGLACFSTRKERKNRGREKSRKFKARVSNGVKK